MTYETDERLKGYLDTNQLHREQMCLAIMAIDKRFSNVRPRHPRGGPDGGRDIEAIFNGVQRAFGAVGFVNQANDSEEHKKKAVNKFKDDAASALSSEPKPDVFVFFTNVNLTVSEKDVLIAHAKGLKFADAEIYDRERIRISLDNPDGLGIRYQYLKLPLSDAEQATFFARWGDDIQSVISNGFNRIERMLNRLQFFHEADRYIRRMYVSFVLDREYDHSEIGHVRAFAHLFYGEPIGEAYYTVFGLTDNAERVETKSADDLNDEECGVGSGVSCAQWNGLFVKSSSNRGGYASKHEMVTSSHGSGMKKILSLTIDYTYSEFDILVGRPRIKLKDLEDCDAILSMNKSLAEKLKSIIVVANQYKIAEIATDEFRICDDESDPEIPLHFSETEMKDKWVRIRPAHSSCFDFRFSEMTPKRFFVPTDIDP